MQRRRGSSVTSEDFPNRCYDICTLIGCLLCITKMKPSSRILLTWLWLLVIAVIAGSMASKAYFKSTSMTLNPSDMRIADIKWTNWCSNVEVSSERPVDIYRLPDKPNILSAVHDRQTYKLNAVKRMPAYQYEHWKFYLLNGSSIRINICMEYGKGTVYVLQGEANFQKYQTHPSCAECYVQYMPVAQGSCENMLFTVTETDQYYLVVLNVNYQTAITVHMESYIARAVYDVTKKELTCEQEVSCTVPLDEGARESIVVKYTLTSQTRVSDQTTVKAKCKPRYGIFVPVFVVIPLCVGLCITGLILARARRCRQGHQRTDSDIFTITRSGRNRSSSGVVSPAFFLEPPSYADSCGDAPPTYDEAMRMKNLQSEI